MRITTTLLAFALAGTLGAQSMTDNPQLASTKGFYDQIKQAILKSADKLPEDKYGFKPSDDVRTYGQLLAHVADGQYIFCSIVKDGKMQPKGVEKTAKTKAEIVAALNESFAYCDAVYAGLTDATSAALVPWFGGQRTKLSMLAFNTAHTFEHYGNLVTYMRMNGVVPPSSEPRK
jgi:uncharacterized damage-inducible protein DinB